MIREIQDSGIGWHFLCDIHSPQEDFTSRRAQYNELGYRALSTEWLFIHDMKDIPDFESDPQVRLVSDQDVLSHINQIASQPRKLQPGSRLYSAWDEGQDFGWVTSVPYRDSAWVANLYVHREFRGKGFGRALMSKLLNEDRENGVKQSVLLASSDGARLYPHLGYQQIGILQMFCPINGEKG